ncbi:hypothetical protein [Nonomuraea cavernae]|uniref:Uncharacterized protein n=1 Tax=Nonomuraea cavernae TaxID=2045107 RepID=A0A918DU81_9ACTN|nr:hypothetical protein [Nonomuraea cavernae]MCA2190956.1 hypothetical protein [Nonomuraea cavernae]GGO83471.1 hypothetical protein GCM10012289_77000 [Nonomuraea cavernae]
MTLPNPADYGLTPEQADACIDQVLDQRAEAIVDGIMESFARMPVMTPRVALALARRLQRRYGSE